MTQKQLTNLLRVWQKLFQFQDWNISVRVVSRASQNGDYYLGKTTIDKHHRRARIAVLHPNEVNDEDANIADAVRTLAHEFVHIVGWSRFSSLEDPVESAVSEQTIDALAGGIVELSRRAGLVRSA